MPPRSVYECMLHLIWLNFVLLALVSHVVTTEWTTQGTPDAVCYGRRVVKVQRPHWQVVADRQVERTVGSTTANIWIRINNNV